MQRTYIKELAGKVGEEVMIKGWVDIRRDHGKLIFIDLRDMSGKVQMVVLPNHKEAGEVAKTLRPEWVVEITGKINARPEKMVNKEESNGSVEVEVIDIKVLNEAMTPAIDVRSDGKEIGEDARLKYRYLDLRRPRMQKNIRNRFKLMQFVRNALDKEGFTEIETPSMTASTPEGSRDFIVPSRLEQGKFYALPQSPQQYKQLLMSSGFEKYFQFARCYRDEDTRGDRQPEFTQMDLEMSFPTEEEIMQLNEKILIESVQKLYPHKKIQQIPFPRIIYKEAMEKYNSDKPDIRTDKNDPNLLAFCWVVDFPMFEKTDDGKWTFTHNPFSATKPESMGDLMNKTNIEKIGAAQYDITLNGYEIGGGSIRNHRPEALKKVFEIMGYPDERIEKSFGHMLRAFEAGTPPHGGIAWGLDRLMMILENEPNIREVIAFAKTGEGRDLMMDAPSEVSPEQLRDLGIEIKKKK
jgi:aspartyl-tRNA synthetase